MKKSRNSVVLPVATPDGDFIASYSSAGLCGLSFPSNKRLTAPANLPSDVRKWHALTEASVKAILAGREPRSLPPLDLSEGTDFQQSVWRALLAIGRGKTSTYKEVAGAISRARAVRAVGGACGANPIPLLVPCHRVLAANRRLGGFSGGLHWKRTLLKREGIAISEAPSVTRARAVAAA